MLQGILFQKAVQKEELKREDNTKQKEDNTNLKEEELTKEEEDNAKQKEEEFRVIL